MKDYEAFFWGIIRIIRTLGGGVVYVERSALSNNVWSMLTKLLRSVRRMYLQMLLRRMYSLIWCIYKCYHNKRMQKRFGYFRTFLLCSFTNAKLERVFSRMNRVKTDRRSSLTRDRLDVLLRISEDGPSLEEFNPGASIDC